MKRLILILIALVLSACGCTDNPTGDGSADTNALGQSKAECHLCTPEGGCDLSLCGITDTSNYTFTYNDDGTASQMVIVCNTPVTNPWWNQNLSCTAEGFQEGRVWCCITPPTNATP